MAQLRRYPMLTSAEHSIVIEQMKAGHVARKAFIQGKLSLEEHEERLRVASEAREKLINSNLRLVVNIAQKYVKHISFEDAINEGNLGLIKAVEKYDSSISTRFSTYATYWIRQAISASMVNLDKQIHLPSYLVEVMGQITQASEGFFYKHDRQPTVEELAEILEIHKSCIQNAVDAKYIVNLFAKVHYYEQEDDGNSLPWVRDRGLSPFEIILSKSTLEEVICCLEHLTPKESEVIRLKYGFSGEDPMKHVDIGKRMGLTRERVRQLEKKSLARLRWFLRKS